MKISPILGVAGLAVALGTGGVSAQNSPTLTTSLTFAGSEGSTGQSQTGIAALTYSHPLAAKLRGSVSVIWGLGERTQGTTPSDTDTLGFALGLNYQVASGTSLFGSYSSSEAGVQSATGSAANHDQYLSVGVSQVVPLSSQFILMGSASYDFAVKTEVETYHLNLGVAYLTGGDWSFGAGMTRSWSDQSLSLNAADTEVNTLTIGADYQINDSNKLRLSASEALGISGHVRSFTLSHQKSF